MEEILASIRRIISEDGAAEEAEPAPAPKAAKPAPKPQPVAEPEPEPEVDFEPVPAEEPEPEPEPEPEIDEEVFVPEEEEEDILDLTEKVEDEPEVEPLFEEQKRRAQAVPPPAFEDEDEGLVSPPKREEAISAFANLTSTLEARHPELPIGAGHKTLESLTKEVMRPMLKEWLDKNLPHIVERLVREEIERIARQGQRHLED